MAGRAGRSRSRSLELFGGVAEELFGGIAHELFGGVAEEFSEELLRSCSGGFLWSGFRKSPAPEERRAVCIR